MPELPGKLRRSSRAGQIVEARELQSTYIEVA
jgi:hypothetical protein